MKRPLKIAVSCLAIVVLLALTQNFWRYRTYTRTFGEAKIVVHYRYDHLTGRVQGWNGREWATVDFRGLPEGRTSAH